jgi:aprataxin
MVQCANELLKESCSVKMGFHAIPSMTHLHMHIISQDFTNVKLKKHYLSMTSPFFVTVNDVIHQLEQQGHVQVN